MSVLGFIDSDVFEPVFQNDIPFINSPRIEAICREIAFAVKNGETIFVYGDYDMDGFSCVMVWKEVFSLMRAKDPVVFKYRAKTHAIDRDILNQVEGTGARVVIICDTGSGVEDKHVLHTLESRGYTTITIDHHVYCGDYPIECEHRLIFNSHEEAVSLDNCPVSGAYASLLVAKVLCEKYMDCPLAFNAKVYALASMYSDCVDMSTPVGRALYNAVASAKADGPALFMVMNKWNYLYRRRFFSYIVAPKLNGCFRTERLDLLNRLLETKDRYQIRELVDELEEVHSEASALTSILVDEFEQFQFGEILLCVHKATEKTRLLHIRNFTGVVASRIAQEHKCAVVTVVQDNLQYAGSFRDYYNRPMLQKFSLFCMAGGHPAAFGLQFGNMSNFKLHLELMNKSLTTEVEKPYTILHSGVIEDDADIRALALYNDYMNVKPGVLISHCCKDPKVMRSTSFYRYYSIGLPTDRPFITKRSLVPDAHVLIEPAICRSVELREKE